MPSFGECTVSELARRRAAGEAPPVLDVRNDDELDVAAIDGVIHIPMPRLPERVEELEAYKNQELIVMCHLGGRSARVSEWLAHQGFANVRNLTGGIDAWSREVDDTVPVY